MTTGSAELARQPDDERQFEHRAVDVHHSVFFDQAVQADRKAWRYLAAADPEGAGNADDTNAVQDFLAREGGKKLRCENGDGVTPCRQRLGQSLYV